MATADGTVQTFVIAGEVTPTWAEQAPACITQGRRLKAIRSEVKHITMHHGRYSMEILRCLVILTNPCATIYYLAQHIYEGCS